MPYNQLLAQRIHAILGGYAGISEKKMFGGIGYMVHGNMAAVCWGRHDCAGRRNSHCCDGEIRYDLSCHRGEPMAAGCW
jgi:hypothetical protein